MRVLVTGFEPFGGECVNPSFEAVKLLPNTVAEAEIIKLELPTVFSESAAAIEAAIQTHRPDIILSVGQAGGRRCITPEKVAINLADALIVDNAGAQPVDRPLQVDGETAYFATVPVKAMVRNMKEHGIPAEVSYTAGTFVCNAVMYNTQYLIAKKYPGIRAGFIHVPFAAEQCAGKPDGTPFMELAVIAKGLEYAIEAAVLESDESRHSK